MGVDPVRLEQRVVGRHAVARVHQRRRHVAVGAAGDEGQADRRVGRVGVVRVGQLAQIEHDRGLGRDADRPGGGGAARPAAKERRGRRAVWAIAGRNQFEREFLRNVDPRGERLHRRIEAEFFQPVAHVERELVVAGRTGVVRLGGERRGRFERAGGTRNVEKAVLERELLLAAGDGKAVDRRVRRCCGEQYARASDAQNTDRFHAERR